MTAMVKRALLSAYRKDGLIEFGGSLAAAGVEILSTGGTAKTLRNAGIPVLDVAAATRFPEMMDGRVKTLHPRIHGGILFRRDLEAHRIDAELHGIQAIDLVYVDLYPFESVARRPGASREEIVEMIDIGGPAMIRAAAKNHDHVLVVVDPADLSRVRSELETCAGSPGAGFRRDMAAKAFRRTAAYDAEIALHLTGEPFPERLTIPLTLRSVARYGENPHQRGAIYTHGGAGPLSVAAATQLSGKELSYNNFLDASAAAELVAAFDEPAAAVIKHRNPCGAALGEDAIVAVERALQGDGLSAFGGILAVNRPLTPGLVRSFARKERFLEVVIAPQVAPDALEILQTSVKWGRSVRVLEARADPAEGGRALELRSIHGGVLVQDADEGDAGEFRVATRRAPSDAEVRDLRFAQAVVRHVTSNAIVLVRDRMLVGVGAGQMSRVDSVALAVGKAGSRARGSVLGSDAFFPFPDGIHGAADGGVAAVAQPGGSVRDDQVIAAADERGLAMVMTGRRHFRH